MLDDLKREINEKEDQIGKIREFLQIDPKKEKIEELKKETQSNELWSDPEKAKKILQELKTVERAVRSFDDLKKSFDDRICAYTHYQRKNQVYWLTLQHEQIKQRKLKDNLYYRKAQQE